MARFTRCIQQKYYYSYLLQKITMLVNDYYDNPKIMCVKKFKFLIGVLGHNVINLTTNLFLGIPIIKYNSTERVDDCGERD